MNLPASQPKSSYGDLRFERTSSGILISRLAICMTVVLGLIFVACALPRFNQNDFMYAVAPTMLASGSLYTDIPFMQAPLAAHLYAAVARAVAPEYLYPILRTLSLAALVGSAFFAYAIAASIAGRMVGLLSVILFFTSYYLAYVSWEIGNYSLALLLFMAAAHTALTKSPTLLACAFVGLCIGLAGASKLNHAIFAIPFAVMIGQRQGYFSPAMRAYFAGGLLGASPLIYHAVHNFDSFYFFNVDVHHLVNRYRDEYFPNSFADVWAASREFLVWSLLHICATAMVIYRMRGAQIAQSLREIVLLSAAAYVLAIIPSKVFPQYFAPLAAIVSVAAAISWVTLFRRARTGRLWVWIAGTFALLLWAFPYTDKHILPGMRHIGDGRIAASELREFTEAINERTVGAMAKRGCSNTVVSLSAIPFWGTPFQPTVVSATGPFLSQLRSIIETEAPKFSRYADVEQYLRGQSPGAIMVGFFPKHPAEGILEAFASDNAYKEYHLGPFDRTKQMRLFLHPSCVKSVS